MDFLIFQKINNLAGKSVYFDWLAVFFAEYLGYVLAIILFLFLLKNWKKYWQIAIKSLGAAILARFCIAELIRFFWDRPRPFSENKVNLLLSHETTNSFPSGHAAFFFALSTVIFLYYKKFCPASKFWRRVSVLFFIASFLISVARVFGGIHWPSDILAGAVVGIFSGWLTMKIFKK